MTDLRHGVGNAVSMIFVDPIKQCFVVRGSLSLRSSFLGEKVLQCLEAAFLTCGLIDLPLKVRADCQRLADSASPNSKERWPESSKRDRLASEGVRNVILALFLWELLSVDVNVVDEEDSTRDDRQNSWEKLQESAYHDWFSNEGQDYLPVPPTTRVTADQSCHSLRCFVDLSNLHSLSVERIRSSDTKVAPIMFDAIHLLYEELKLHNLVRRDGLDYVGSILSEACWMAIQNPAVSNQTPQLYLSHYARDLENRRPSEFHLPNSHVQLTSAGIKREGQLTFVDSPPCILSWLEGIFCGKPIASIYNDIDYWNVNAGCPRTRSFVRICSSFHAHESNQSVPSGQSNTRRQRDLALVNLLIEEGFRDQTTLCEELPVGICLPFLEVLHRCRTEEIEEYDVINVEAWSLIGRDDLFNNLVETRGKSSRAAGRRSAAAVNPRLVEAEWAGRSDRDGVAQLEITSSMLFPHDNRLREVGRLLRSSRPVYLHVPRAIEVSDHDYERKKQEKLLLSSRRTLALPVGRGMLTIGNLKPVPAEPLPVPELCLAGRVPPTDATLALDTSECPTDLKVWPEFHNGVAAGLRLPLHEEAGESVSKITRTWIVYNRPNNDSSGEPPSNSSTPESLTHGLNHAHGGLLMALGLRGHLTALEMTDIFDYLTHGTVTTTVGVLLGMAAK
jgi:hypothetical protein